MAEMIIPDGHRPGLPLVKVSQDEIYQLGPVVVDYDGLEDMFHGHFGVPTDEQVNLRLKPLRSAAGTYNQFTDSIKIDPTKAYRHDGHYIGLTRILLHEGQHYSDSFNRTFKLYGESALKAAAIISAGAAGTLIGYQASELAGLSPDLTSLVDGALSLAGSVPVARSVMGGYLYRHSPAENRARETQYDDDLEDKYAEVIDFPERYSFLETGVAAQTSE